MHTTSKDITSRQIGHLGLAAGMIDELGILPVIDEAIPKTRDHILPHSKVIEAMLLNGLGFNERRLYLFSRFFTNLSTEQLLGPGITPERMMFFFAPLIAFTITAPQTCSTGLL